MRLISPAVEAAFAAKNLRLILLGEFYLAEGTSFVCNASQNFTWNGNTYLGAAKVGRIDPIEEGTEVKMYGIALTLSGIPGEQMALALGTHYQGKTCIIRAAVLDSDYAIVASPVVIFRGRIDQKKIKLGKYGALTVTVENRLADWDRARVGRFNNEDQRARSPSDRFCEFVPQMVERALNWGVSGGTTQGQASAPADLGGLVS